MTRMTGLHYTVMRNLINTHIHTYTCRVSSEVSVINIIDPFLGGSMQVA